MKHAPDPNIITDILLGLLVNVEWTSMKPTLRSFYGERLGGGGCFHLEAPYKHPQKEFPKFNQNFASVFYPMHLLESSKIATHFKESNIFL